MTLTVFLQYCLAGISIGGIYALIAIGYTMVYGILRLINFAHGDIFMMAAYFMIFAMVDFAIPWYISMIIMIIATVVLGVIIEGRVCASPQCAPYVGYDFSYRCIVPAAECGYIPVLGTAKIISFNSCS